MTTERLFAKNCVFKSQNNCDTRELQKKKIEKKRNENNTQYYDNDWSANRLPVYRYLRVKIKIKEHCL